VKRTWLKRQKNLRSGLQHHEPLHVKRRFDPTLFDEGLKHTALQLASSPAEISPTAGEKALQILG
jgi:hypothetical protein